jgi:hypothetical protein
LSSAKAVVEEKDKQVAKSEENSGTEIEETEKGAEVENAGNQ